MATIRDVAKLAGCSTATVSRFYNGKRVSPEMQHRVTHAIEALAFSPNVVARNLKLKRSRILGMVIPDISEPFFPAVVKGVESVARARGYSLMLFNTQESAESEARCLEILASHQCEGIVLIHAAGQESRFREKLATLPVPIVYLDRAPDDARDAVVIDNVAGARRGVDHLLRLGHRRIAIVMLSDAISTHRDRLDGFRAAHREHGVAVRPGYVVRIPSGVNDAYSATLELLASPEPPTAIFATNVRLTLGVMRAVASRGLSCPGDVSVLGHDGFDWQDVFHPRMTTVAQPADELGHKAAELLIQRVSGELVGPPKRLVLSPELVVRESCGVYRGHVHASLATP